MRRIIALLVVALALSGCASLQRALDVANIATASISNPVTPTMLYDMENGAIIAVAALNAYRQTCVQGTIPPSCKTVIRSIQVYTRQIPPLLAALRKFVRENDQVNAVIVYNAIGNLIAGLRATAAQNNVGVP
jgi:uncharacterized protein YceK